MKKLFLILVIVCMTAACAHARIWYVTEQGGTSNTGKSWRDALLELYAAIDSANSGDEIWVAAGTYSLPSGQYYSMKPGVKIYGGIQVGASNLSNRSKSTLTGNTLYVFFNNSSAVDNTALLDGFIIENTGGGGICNNRASPTISNCIVQGCTDNGIANINCGAVIQNTIIRGNTSSLSIRAGGISNSGVTSGFRLINVLVSGNTSSYNGNMPGGIYNNACNGRMINVTVSGNFSTGGVGGISMVGSSQMSLENSIVWGNRSGSGLETSDFSSDNGNANEIKSSLLGGCGWSGDTWNTTYGMDGGWNMDTDPLFVDYRCAPNAISPDTSGDFRLTCNSPAINVGDDNLNPLGTDLAGNARMLYSWGIDIGAYEFQSIACSERLYVDANVMLGDGNSWRRAFNDFYMAVRYASSSPGIKEIWVAKGTYPGAYFLPDNVKIYGGFVSGNYSLSQRNWEVNRCILQGNGSSVFSNNNTGNNAVLDGFTIRGGNYATGGGMYNNFSSPTIQNCHFENNSTSWGGGIYNENSSLTLINVTFYANNALYDGGGIYNINSSLSILDCRFEGNGSQSGGGIFNSSSTVVLTNVDFLENTASDGGGMLNYYSSCTLNNVSITGNKAGYGGGILNYYSSSLSFNNVYFEGNKADKSGGGIYNEYSDFVMNDGYFVYNTAEYKGGGIYNGSSSPSMVNIDFVENRALNDGGGLYNYNSSPILKDLTFFGNTAGNFGGGIANEGNCGNMNTENIDIVNNTAGSGGGISNMEINGHVTFYRLTVDGNTADFGGGIYNDDNHWVKFNNTVISGNTARRFGGGMYNRKGKEIHLTNVTLAGNISSNGGGSMYNENIAYGFPMVSNSIIWGNKNLILNQGSTPSYQSCIVEGTSVMGWYRFGQDMGANMDIDPEFLNFVIGSPHGNYRLQLSSPAINSGDQSLLINTKIDRDGNPRVMFSNVDMGAYECQYKSARRMDEETSPNTETATSEVNVKIYPNPVSSGNHVSVEINTEQESFSHAEIEAYNNIGVKVGKCSIGTGNTTLTLPKEKGLYLLKIIVGAKIVKVEKVIVK